MAGEHAGHRQRMRERFRSGGLDGFADHEVLELMLFYAIPQRNVNPLAHELIAHFGSLYAVLDAPAEELCRVEGVGENAATLLSLFSHAARRLEKSRSSEKKMLRNRGEAERHCRNLLKGLRQEHFYVVCMDSQMHINGDVLIGRGTLDEVQAYPRLVAEAVLRHNARSVILCHNHPGGSAIPSAADVETTRVLADLFATLGVTLIDHMVVAADRTLSMASCGLIVHATGGGMISRVADCTGELLIRAKLEKRLEDGNL